MVRPDAGAKAIDDGPKIGRIRARRLQHLIWFVAVAVADAGREANAQYTSLR